MNVLGIIIVVALCVVLALALFFEVKSLIKSIDAYKKKKNKKQDDVKKEATKDK